MDASGLDALKLKRENRPKRRGWSERPHLFQEERIGFQDVIGLRVGICALETSPLPPLPRTLRVRLSRLTLKRGLTSLGCLRPLLTRRGRLRPRSRGGRAGDRGGGRVALAPLEDVVDLGVGGGHLGVRDESQSEGDSHEPADALPAAKLEARQALGRDCLDRRMGKRFLQLVHPCGL